MRKKLIIIGAGGFAKSVLESIDLVTYEIVGFIDSFKEGTHQNLPILSNSIRNIDDKTDYSYFVAIGEPKDRAKWLDELSNYKLDIITVIDPTALISKTAILGSGVYIGKMSIINSDTHLADGTVINTRSLIEHGNKIGYCSNISTNVVLNGDVRVGRMTFVGSCTVVNGQISIGDNSIIGSGSVVIRDIPNNVVVVGSPTRIIKEI